MVSEFLDCLNYPRTKLALERERAARREEGAEANHKRGEESQAKEREIEGPGEAEQSASPHPVTPTPSEK
jgi:hypothetical protein